VQRGGRGGAKIKMMRLLVSTRHASMKLTTMKTTSCSDYEGGSGDDADDADDM
jgi:hypothetical protein